MCNKEPRHSGGCEHPALTSRTPESQACCSDCGHHLASAGLILPFFILHQSRPFLDSDIDPRGPTEAARHVQPWCGAGTSLPHSPPLGQAGVTLLRCDGMVLCQCRDVGTDQASRGLTSLGSLPRAGGPLCTHCLQESNSHALRSALLCLLWR